MHFAEKRQQFLVDQGYFFQVIKEMPYVKDPTMVREPCKMESKTEQNKLLQDIMR
jgi:hypothetical protein